MNCRRLAEDRDVWRQGLKRPRPKLGCRTIEERKNKQEKKKILPVFSQRDWFKSDSCTMV
jgi:hypothetical protein